MSFSRFKWVIHDTIDASRTERFYKLLTGSPCYKLTNEQLYGSHLLYYNFSNQELDSDGYFGHQTPRQLMHDDSLTYKRRVWAQGKITFIRPFALLQSTKCIEQIAFIKKVRSCHYVSINRDIEDDHGILIKESRTLAYTDSIDNPNVQKHISDHFKTIGHYTFDDMSIVQYSQLSMNPHRIHWDRDYVRNVEKYKDIIAQGPFMVQVMLSNVAQQLPETVGISKVTYKNTNALLAGTTAKVQLYKASTDVWKLQLINGSSIYASMVVWLNKL